MFQSLCNFIIEEIYELVDVILEDDLEGIKEEIGDFMFYMVFYVKIVEEKEVFDIVDVLYVVCEKFIKCYFYIYGDLKVENEE